VVIAYDELADRRTVIVDVPTNVCVLILYATAPGTVTVIAPGRSTRAATAAGPRRSR
jgi:hypothetical protein